MKRITSAVFLLTLFLCLIAPLWAQDAKGSAPAPSPAALNPLRIALLKWYDVNITTSFAVGDEPRGVCFDGANIWVANYGSGTVTKLQANDGTVLGTYNVGHAPANIAFDGANVWVTNFGSASVTELRASDGTLVGTFAISGQPFGIAFDGANIWVGNAGGSAIVTKLRASDGLISQTTPGP